MNRFETERELRELEASHRRRERIETAVTVVFGLIAFGLAVWVMA